jgi:hypothetical protein
LSFKSRRFFTLHASQHSCRNLIGDYFDNFDSFSLCKIQKPLEIDFLLPFGRAEILWKTERFQVLNSNQESRIFHEIVLQTSANKIVFARKTQSNIEKVF